jgi:hypothetical protein
MHSHAIWIGLRPEMAKIGVERLRAGGDQEHQAHDDQADHAVRKQELHAQQRVEREEDARVVDQVHQAAHGEHAEPDERYGPEVLRHLGRAARLHREQPDQDHHRDRKHRQVQQSHEVELRGDALQLRSRQLETLHRRQHRDRRRDHRIAIEEGGAGHPQHQEQRRAPLCHRLAERHQREGAALALVVGVEQHQHVLERDDQQQRPRHQRQDAEHRFRARRAVVGSRLHRLAQRVQRGGADVPIDDADRAQC